jgi:hypothetical protein
MSATRTTLYDLLPQVLRMRDSAAAVVTPGLLAPADRASLESLQATVAGGGALTAAQQTQLAQLTAAATGGPLASLMAIFEEQVLALRENLDQLYDDHFIETCADWVAPYVGDLISYRPLHGVTPEVASPRAEVAHTIGYRRRKGTITVIEQLARDVTGWNATAVEFFQRLTVTQYMNHIRRECLASPDLRDWRKLERVGGGAFDRVMRTFEARKVASGRGRYNIPNVGVYLWRLDPYSLTRSPAAMVDATRGRFHPLGIDSALVTLPKTETRVMSLATPLNVPEPITRRDFAKRTADYYTGADKAPKSLTLYVGPPNALVAIDPSLVVSCNLADSGTGWAHAPPAGKYAIDVALGRFALPAAPPTGAIVAVDFHYAFSAPIGGGEYNRQTSSLGAATPPKLVRVPTDAATISAALAALDGAGVVEIEDSGRYAEALAVSVAANATIELRAANARRPTVWLGAPMELSGAAGSAISINGLLFAGADLHVGAGAANALAQLTISHCTLTPGLSLSSSGAPTSPIAPSLVLESPTLATSIDHSILGGLRAHTEATVAISDSVLDATSTIGVAYAAIDNASPGASLTLKAVTAIGKIDARQFTLVSNSILIAALATGDTWAFAVNAARRQIGCTRFSYLPPSACAPRRYRCLPDPDADPRLSLPSFSGLRYGAPGYCQLSATAGQSLLTGADDEGEPGAFHSIYQAQRENNLGIRLAEYMRASMEAGIFHQS